MINECGSSSGYGKNVDLKAIYLKMLVKVQVRKFGKR